MDIILTRTIVLLIVAIFVAILARRIHLPYTVGLVLVGAGFALAHIGTGITLTHDFIFDVILPPLLFEAALNIHWKELRRDMLPVLTLASLGVLVSAVIVALGMAYFLGWPWPSSLIFGILIAATDPVAVIAMFKDCNVTGRVRLLVESESLLNDGVAAVFFALALFWSEQSGGMSISPGYMVQAFAITFGGGIVVGAISGGVAIAIAGRTKDHLVEAALTTVVAYGSFLLAEHLHVSGVLATVTSGLLMGNLGVLKADNVFTLFSERGRTFILEFWEFVAFLANSLVFLLIGLRIGVIPFTTLGLTGLSIIIVLSLTARALAVYPLCLLFIRSRWVISFNEQHILWWGGLRGALALALALSLPDSLPLQDDIRIAAFTVVAFSVFVQGLTMPLLFKKLKVA